MAEFNVSGDSNNYISAAAWETINYLYYKWGINKTHTVKVTVTDKPDEKQEMPCLSCYRMEMCKKENHTCGHLKAWQEKGYFDPNSCSWK